MDKAFFLNGVFESVLTEIIEMKNSADIGLAYLQPYATGSAKLLEQKSPSPLDPIIGYFSTTKRLTEITYSAEIIGWEDKRQLTDIRKKEVNSFLIKNQPGEDGLYLLNKEGKEYVNLIKIRNLKKLKRAIPVTHLTKVSNKKPHGIRSQAGGWSTVYLLPSDNDVISSYLEKQVEDKLREDLKGSLSINRKQRLSRLEVTKRKPDKIKIVSTGYFRNPDVITEVLLRANGVCERCKKPAPFNRTKDGTPYLEVHHKIYLADDGDDSVDNAEALCPNCHREAHFG